MIARRIIPCLDVRDGRVVKGVNFEGIKDVADPVDMAAFYNDEGADELVFYDITASHEGRGLFTDVLKRTAARVFIPLTVGGGVSGIADFERVLNSGADKVSVNSAAVKNPDIIDQAARRYGNQCVVLSMDVKRVGGKYSVFVNGGRVDTGIDALEWARQGQERGAGELVVNSIDTDGVRGGFDIAMLNDISAQVSIPIVASGGAGNAGDFYRLFAECPSIDAGLAASIFHSREVGIGQLKKYLAEQGVPMRIIK
ncbi:MAG: imidazole glycerol phosphate synthase subunit HisF [Clostridia bacterium]|nr:imidazole glycerol phosphate synthase subunit HisF [Clostridia bacterium]